MKGRRGAALITGLLMTVFMLILGLAYLTFMEQDYRFAGKHNSQTKAYYLAVSATDYYKARSFTFSSGETRTLAVPPGDPHQRFDVTVLADGTVRCRGYLIDSSGQVHTERTLVAPLGDFGNIYDESQ